MNWRQNPSRVAWVILLVSFCSCCLLAVAVPLGARSILLHATRPKKAFVQATVGTAQLWGQDGGEPVAITEQRPIAEGSRLVTDDRAKAVLNLYADDDALSELGTIQLAPATEFVLERARTPRFGISRDPHQLGVVLSEGRLFVTTQRAENRDVLTSLVTPHAAVIFGPGALDVVTDAGETVVRVRSGLAQVSAQNGQVTAIGGERVRVAAGLAPESPITDTVNLVVNGGFEGQLQPHWSDFAEVKPGYEAGTVELVTEGARRAVRFSRRTEDGMPNRVGVAQLVNQDVEGYDRLALRFDLKLLYQSVPGGGEQATEYPVMVDLAYTDIYGKDLHWYQGFYFFDLPPGSPYPPPTGEKVPLGTWYTYESPNLFVLLGETRPARINSITLYAIGHDYEGFVTDVALTVH